MSEQPLYSVLIPVYNSQEVVGTTVHETIKCFKQWGKRYEIVLVNDGSRDNSWPVIQQLATENEGVVAINLLKNYGQHSAVLCAIYHATGDYLITMDDDMQNPPSELIHLINKIAEGHDLVFAQFKKKRHSLFRRMGTKVIDYLNTKIFNKPDDLILTNFRIFTKGVAERVKQHHTSYPYIPGLVLMYSSSTANVLTEHHPRTVGKSGYNIFKIGGLVSRLLFNYSSFPLKFLTTIGFTISLLSFAAGIYYLVRAISQGTQAAGFPTLVILLSFLCGFIIIMLGVIGEYLARIMNQLSSNSSFQVKSIVRKP